MTHGFNVDKIRKELDFNPDTGVFSWKVARPGLWVGCRAGHYPQGTYATIQWNKTPFSVHRLAWLYFYGEWPDCDIDHINGDKHDNRIENLRKASRGQNNLNSNLPRSNSTGHKGVLLCKRSQKYRAYIGFKGKKIRLGLYPTLQQAVTVRRAAAKHLYGAFAKESQLPVEPIALAIA